MTRFIPSLCLLLFAYPVLARSVEPKLLVGLHLQSQRLELAYSGVVRRTHLDRLDLVWHEQLSPWLNGNIRLGKFNLTQDSNPIAAGQSGSGNTLGLGLGFRLYHGDQFHLQFKLGYQYATSTDELAGQTVDLRWHQVSGEVRADIRLIRYSYLRLAAGAMAIDGDERASGTVNSVHNFKSDRSGYGRLGIIIGLDPSSHIGLEVDTGSITGGRITFQRWF